MYEFLQILYSNFREVIQKIFETLTMRTPPDYEKLSEDGEESVFNGSERKNNKSKCFLCFLAS
jgi:hypothetical protein